LYQLKSLLRTFETVFNNRKRYQFLSWNELNEIRNLINKQVKIDQTVCEKVYREIIYEVTKTGKEREEKLPYNRYLWLRVIDSYNGNLPIAQDKLLMIDEAQSIALTEYSLIRSLMPNVILNLYGDVQQKTENERGFGSWKEILKLGEYTVFNLNENYRNSKEITEYCNQELGLDMRPISLEIEAVRECVTFQEFVQCLRQKSNLLGKETVAVISKNSKKIYQQIIRVDMSLKGKLVINDGGPIDQKKINIFKIEQVKGLEFHSVGVVENAMADNEKYIAYTRALNSLMVIKLPENDETQNSKSRDKKKIIVFRGKIIK